MAEIPDAYGGRDLTAEAVVERFYAIRNEIGGVVSDPGLTAAVLTLAAELRDRAPNAAG